MITTFVSLPATALFLGMNGCTLLSTEFILNLPGRVLTSAAGIAFGFSFTLAEALHMPLLVILSNLSFPRIRGFLSLPRQHEGRYNLLAG